MKSSSVIRSVLDERSREIRAVCTTGVLGVLLVGTPLVVVLVVLRVLSNRGITGADGAGLGRADVVPLLVALTAICTWLPGAVAVVGELRGRGRPVRPSRFMPSSIRRVVAAYVETSLLGAGTLEGWTSTRVAASLDQLEVPVRRVVDAPRDTNDPVEADVIDAARPWPGLARLAALRGPATAPPSLQGVPTTAYLVKRGDTWWGLAARFLGDGRRFAELKQRNVGRSEPDGTVVGHDTVLRAGWTVDIPTNDAMA